MFAAEVAVIQEECDELNNHELSEVIMGSLK